MLCFYIDITTRSTLRSELPVKKPRRSERCPCGLDECNNFAKTLGAVFHDRCYYTPVENCVTDSQRLRSQMIYEKLCEWRREFCPNDKPEPTKTGRFNEIHYPREFLEYSQQGNGKSVCKTIPIDEAIKFGMYQPEYVFEGRVVVVPSLTSRDAWRNRRKDDYESGVDVKPSKVHGKGLFAKKRFNDGEIICRYSGTLVPDDGTTTIVSDFLCTVGETKDGRTTRYYIDSTDPANSSGRWCNHSCLPNARLVLPVSGEIERKEEYPNQGSILVQCHSRKGIGCGQEIKINYGKEYFTINGVLDHTFFSGIRLKMQD